MGFTKRRTLTDLHSKTEVNPDYFEGKMLGESRKRRYAKLITIITFIVIILVSILSYTSVRFYNLSEYRERSTQAREIAKLASTMIDLDDDSTRISQTVRDIKNSFSQIYGLYVYRFDGDEERILFGEMPEGFDKNHVIMAHEPIYNSKGQIAAHIMASLSTEDIKSRTSLYTSHVVGSSVLLLLLALIIGCHISVKYFMNDNSRILNIKTKQDKKLVREIAQAFAKTIDMRDNYTNGHSFRVADYSSKIARELGFNEEVCAHYYNVALLHDVGKIGIPRRILQKTGKLTEEEYLEMKKHTVYGFEILKSISIMPELADGALHHHERFDGKGYPDGLKGNEIPKVAQIISVADAFDAMYSNRPYRQHVRFDKAVNIIEENSGTQFASDVVDAFIRLVERGELFNTVND